MGFFEDAGDNITAFFGGSTPEKVRQNRQRVNSFKQAKKPLPSIQKDLGNRQALAIPASANARPSDQEMNDILRRNTEAPGSQARYANKMLSDEAARGNPQPHKPDFFEQLMGEFQTQWGGVDKSKIDYSPLDNALKARMDAINGIRTQTNDNFQKSDGNLESMHNGFQNHIATDGAAAFNRIANTEKANLGQVNTDAQANLMKIKAEDMAKRQAMLQNLGIQESGATPDSSADVLTQTQGSIANRNEAEMVNAEQDRASSLAFNQGMAQSVGQQGVERRAALQQQLQGILGKLGMVEADAKSTDAQSRYELEQNQGNQQYQQYRDRQGFLQDTLGMMQDDAQKQAELYQKSQSQDPLEVSGFSGLAQDLLNTGYETPEIQNAMQQLAQVTATDYMKGVDPNAGYSQSAILNKILQQRGIDPMLAIQLATNYGNLGNTSKYQQQ